MGTEMQKLMKQQENEILTRDIGSQIPYEEPEMEDDMETEDGSYGASELSGIGTNINNVGRSFYTQDAIAAQITGINTGR